MTGLDAASPFQGNDGHSQKHVPQQRKRLNLKPRDDKRAAELQRRSSLLTSTSSLFGDSKPREAIIADRDGKTEEEVVREEVRKERLQLRLPPEQNQERLSSQAAVAEIEEQMNQEADERKRAILKAELVARQQKLDRLLERFAKEALSEGGKHTGQRERYSSGRDSTDGVGGNGGMSNPTMPGVSGELHRQPMHQMYHHNPHANWGGHHNNNNNFGHGGGPRPPVYHHGGLPGGQPYMPSPVISGNVMNQTNHMGHISVMPPGPVPLPYYGVAPEGYPGNVRRAGPHAVTMPPIPPAHLQGGHGPGIAPSPGMGQHAAFYQGPPSGVGMGGEIEMDFSNL